MVHKEVFLEKTEALRTAKFIGNFPGYENHKLLPDEIAKKVVNSARKRLRNASILLEGGALPEAADNVGWLRHTQIQLGECLGKGSFSAVYEIKSIKSPRQKIYKTNDVVIKFLRPEMVEHPSVVAASAADLVKEGLLLALLYHDNILSVRAWTPTGLSGYITGRADSFFLVLDRLKEALTDRIVQWREESKKLRYAVKQRGERKVAFITRRLEVLLAISSAVQYLHRKGILHRDLKPDNCGFDQSGVLKLFDFNVARIMPELTTIHPDETFALTNKVGSYRYMSPECARGEEYNLKSDVYSFSLICHEVISLVRPYDDFRSEEHQEMVFQRGARPNLPESWQEGIRTLLQDGWADNIPTRPTMEAFHLSLEKQIPLMIAAKEKKCSQPWLARIQL